MNKLIKTLIISLALYFSHVLILFVLSPFYKERGYVNYGLAASAIYIFIVAYWAYYVLVLLYCMVAKNLNVGGKLIVAGSAMLVGYIGSRGGDIIDGDFIKNFQFVTFLAFLTSSIVIVFFDLILERKRRTD